jgi:hypothetical protein
MLMQLIAAALEKGASENEEATDRRLASLTEVSPLHDSHKHHADIAQDTQWHSKYRIELFDGPTTFRLVQTDQGDQVTEEAVFSIQGVLSGKNLPPVTEKIK